MGILAIKAWVGQTNQGNVWVRETDRRDMTLDIESDEKTRNIALYVCRISSNDSEFSTRKLFVTMYPAEHII